MKRFKTNNGTILTEQDLYSADCITIAEVERLKSIEIGKQVEIDHNVITRITDMEADYSYALLVRNTPEQRLKEMRTLVPTEFKNTEFALIQRDVYPDKTEQVRGIIYSSDLYLLRSLLKSYVSWYDYIDNRQKCMRGYVSEL